MMRSMKCIAIAALLGALGSMPAAAPSGAEQSWIGQVSDSLCRATHEQPEGVEKMSDHDCTLACVRGGSKFVLISDGQIFPIANQDFAGLRTSAGQTVKMTGELKDGLITVSKIEASK